MVDVSQAACQLHLHFHLSLFHVGIDVDVLNPYLAGRGAQFHAAHDAVPVALGLIAHAVGVLPHAHSVDAVVDAYGDVVALPGHDLVGDVELVRRAEAVLVAGLLPVDVDGRLDVGAFEEQHHAAVFPRLGHVDGAAVPGGAHVVLLGCEEEGEFDVALPAVGFHVGVEEVRRVVERAYPACFGAHVVALAVFGHRAGQDDVVGQVAVEPPFVCAHVVTVDFELPASGQVDGVLCPYGKGQPQTCGHPYESLFQHIVAVFYLWSRTSYFELFDLNSGTISFIFFTMAMSSYCLAMAMSSSMSRQTSL